MAAMDYYALLGVGPKADVASIRSAYHALARLHHPDHTGGSNDAMAALNAAWVVLREPSARAIYDGDHGFSVKAPEPSQWAAPAQPSPPPSAKNCPDVLDFGRYAGYSLKDLARRDPDYLLWLERTSIGRRYRTAIDALLRKAPPPLARASRGGFCRSR